MSEDRDIIYFIAQIGHEIRTPLNAIKGFGDLLMDETFGPLNEQQSRYLGKMLNSSDKLLEIVNQILDWAKLESGQVVLQLEDFDLYYLVKEVENLLELKAAAKQIALTSQVDKGTMVTADMARIREVLVNLVGNALKFTDEHGEVKVTVQQNDRQALIAVEDNGRGISQERLEQLFQPFRKGQERRGDEKSTGLGLWICRSIVELHQGRIWVKSEEEAGSTFYVTLPNQGPTEGR